MDPEHTIGAHAGYAHSVVHYAVITSNHDMLREILDPLPPLPTYKDVTTEAESIEADRKADLRAPIIDRRDVEGKETALHLAVRLGDVEAVELLMKAGADSILMDAEGWTALDTAIYSGKEIIAMVICRYRTLSMFNKLCLRMPRVVAELGRIKDFYMEMTFHFESSVIPFVNRIAPSDTIKIWKKGSSVRVDASIDLFRQTSSLTFPIRRLDRSIMFVKDGTTVWTVSHKKKRVKEVEIQDSSSVPSNRAVIADIYQASKSGIMERPGMDVTEARLVPRLTWQRQHKTEMVGPWRAKVFDMDNVIMCVRTREFKNERNDWGLWFNMAEEEKKLTEVMNEKKERTRPGKSKAVDSETLVMPLVRDEAESSNSGPKYRSIKVTKDERVHPEGRVKPVKPGNTSSQRKFSKRLQPALWLSDEFPLKTEELLPLINIMANKLKAIENLRNVLTMKLPADTFPVKMTVAAIPSVKLVMTFTRFQEFTADQPVPGLNEERIPQSSGFFAPRSKAYRSDGPSFETQDPFYIPEDYTWSRRSTTDS